MTKRIVLLAGLVLVTLAAAGPASAAWWGNGRWHPDYRWNNWHDRYYYGYHYRAPPVVYAKPYNYGYYAPPVIYDNAPGLGFSIKIRP